MRKRLLALVIVFLIVGIIGCSNKSQPIGPSDVKPPPIVENNKEQTNQKSEEAIPIILQKAWVTKSALNNPEARITFQNVSDKTIDGVKFLINCYDNFDNPTDVIQSDIVDVITQEVIEPQGIYNGEKYSWSLFPYNNTTKFTAILMEVHFTDGTKWETKDLTPEIKSF